MDMMDVRFYGSWYGKTFYRVVRDGMPIFTGTKGECLRFMLFHAAKRERERQYVAPRRRKHQVRTYRIPARRTGSL